MTLDPVGVLDLPVNYTAEPVGDPVRQLLGEFLQAGIRAACQSAWTQIGGGTNVVERVEVNDPKDNTFSTTKLPALFIYRENKPRTWEILSSDVGYRDATVVAMWVSSLAVQAWKAKREAFFQAIEAAVMDFCDRERTPGWIMDGDTDPIAATEGTNISRAIKIIRPLSYGVSFEDGTLDIEMPNAPTKKFPALKIMFQLREYMNSGPLGPIYPSAVDATLANAADEPTGEIEDLPA
jgi:hypothetical protein